jgi:putative ATP-dependent endonuclease of the OLD family
MCQASSSLSSLVGALLDAATTSAATTWELENADKIEALNKSIAAGIEQSTLLQTNRVNELFQELIPAATLRLTPYISPWSTRVSASVTTRVKIDGGEFDVARHGHGVQRAVMIAMLQAVVPDENGGGEPASDEANQATRQSENGAPAIVIGIEEPEIYQHPIQARHFARVLAGWSSRSSSQVIIATHSPLFLTPEQFENPLGDLLFKTAVVRLGVPPSIRLQLRLKSTGQRSNQLPSAICLKNSPKVSLLMQQYLLKESQIEPSSRL